MNLHCGQCGSDTDLGNPEQYQFKNDWHCPRCNKLYELIIGQDVKGLWWCGITAIKHDFSDYDLQD